MTEHLENKLEALLKRTTDKRQKVNIILKLAWIYKNKDIYRMDALVQDAQSLLSDEPSWLKEQARTLRILAFGVYRRQADYPKALSLALNSLSISEKVGDSETQAGAMRVIALVNLRLLNYSTALEFETKALEVYKKTGDIAGQAHAMIGVGLVYSRSKNNEQELEMQSKAAELFLSINRRSEAGIALNNIAYMYKMLGDYDNAIKFAEDSLTIAMEEEAAYLECTVRDTLGEVYFEINSYEKALVLFLKSFEISEEFNFRRRATKILRHIGKTYVAQKKFKEASSYLFRVLERAKELGDKTDIYLSYELLAQIYEEKGEMKKALIHYQKFFTLKGEVFDEKADSRLKLLQVLHQTETAKQEAEIVYQKNIELEKRVEKRTKEVVKANRQLEQELSNRASLYAIDTAILASKNLIAITKIILEEACKGLNADAASLLLFDENIQQLTTVTWHGFRAPFSKRPSLSIGEGYAGRAAQDNEILYISNISEEPDRKKIMRTLWKDEGFLSYFGVPLIAKGKLKGVWEIFYRTEWQPTQHWYDFLETLAQQSAIAIDNHALREAREVAYETTLEGWARALELRNFETNGHTRRVTLMTERLSKAFDFEEEEIINIRRGAILHDIGKMGVPDSILLKPDRLTEEEREVVESHPEKAFQLLSPILFLRPALDIPLYHHEKWDGTGYPKGLKGEDIPLAARIFAVVDVWDALRSERPYKKTWSDRKAIKYIREQAGKHFDPAVVDVFLRFVDV